MDPKANPSGADYGLKEALQATLAADPAATAYIPLLTTRAFQGGAVENHTLVRYRGMVQDMFEAEFFESVRMMAQPAVDSGRQYPTHLRRHARARERGRAGLRPEPGAHARAGAPILRPDAGWQRLVPTCGAARGHCGARPRRRLDEEQAPARRRQRRRQR